MTNSNSQALADAQRSRAAAADRLAAATKSLHTAQRMNEEAQAKVTQLAQADADTEIALADQLVLAIATGKPTGALPTAATPDAARTAALQTARAYASVTSNAQHTLQRAHANAVEESKAAELSVKVEVFAAVDSEAIALAAQIVENDKKTVAMRERLLAFTIEAIASRPLNERRDWPAGVDAALREPGMFDAPRYLAGLQQTGPHQARIEAARIQWGERIAQLQAGGPAPSALRRA